MSITKNTRSKEIKAILFDMDGVLVDSMAFHLKTWKELLENFNIIVSDEFIYEHEGAMDPEIIVTLFGQHGYYPDPEEILQIYQSQNKMFQDKYLSQVCLYPDSLNLLQRLNRNGILLGLVTSSRRNLVKRIWQEKDLDLFKTIITADDITRFKPFPDPYLKAMEELNQSSDTCLVIENAPAGILSANTAGITCLAISSTLPADKLSAASRVFADLKSLNNFLTEVLF
jgi:beta-phosphoglucomutase